MGEADNIRQINSDVEAQKKKDEEAERRRQRVSDVQSRRQARKNFRESFRARCLEEIKKEASEGKKEARIWIAGHQDGDLYRPYYQERLKLTKNFLIKEGFTVEVFSFTDNSDPEDYLRERETHGGLLVKW